MIKKQTNIQIQELRELILSLQLVLNRAIAKLKKLEKEPRIVRQYVSGGGGARAFSALQGTIADAQTPNTLLLDGSRAMTGALEFGLVMYLPIDEGSGNDIYDYSIESNNGTNDGASWVDGKFGKALSFDGENDYVTGTCGLTGLTSFSVVYWLKWLNNPEKYERPLSLSSDVSFYIDSASGYFAISGDKDLPMGVNLLEGQYYHVALTFDGTNIRPYINGIAKTPSTATIAFATDDYYIGCRNTLTQYFKGLIDEVRIYNRALNKREVMEHYLRGLDQQGGTLNGLTMTGDIDVSANNIGPLLIDRTTATKYRLYVDNGVLSIEEV